MLKRIFKKETRADVLNTFIEHILKEILIHKFSNAEIAIILNSLSDQGKSKLEARREALEKEAVEIQKEIVETTNAINSL